MGVFTQHMTRLCAEIVGLRRGRQALGRALAQGGQARESTVRRMCADFAHTRQAMGSKARQERMAFLATLRRAVNAQRHALQSDLSGVRRVWEGKSA